MMGCLAVWLVLFGLVGFVLGVFLAVFGFIMTGVCIWLSAIVCGVIGWVLEAINGANRD